MQWCLAHALRFLPRPNQDEGECAEYEALWAVGLAIVMGIVFCCCFCGVRWDTEGHIFSFLLRLSA